MRMKRYLVGWGMAVALTACGGGGGGSGGLSLGNGNAKPEASGSTVNAKAAEDADARNGSYRVYAANGTQQQLAVDFDAKTYTMTDNLGQAVSGTFSEDFTEVGTYVFDSSRVTSPANTARFRVTTDAIVGAFPFATAYANPVTYAVQPFVAARAFVTTAAQLDGDYNRFSVTQSPTGPDSQILATRISGSGTLFEFCFDNAIYKMDLCPAASKRSYTLTPAADDAWLATNNANPNEAANFRMARIGGQNVYLGAGVSSIPAVQYLRIGLPNSSNWPATRGTGASTEGSWGTVLLDSSYSVRTATNLDNTYGSLTLPVSGISSLQPEGIRGVNMNGSRKYFAMQNGLLSVVVGVRNTGTFGYIQINLIDTGTAPDARNGRYKVYAANGTRQTLALNLDSKRYEMTDPAGVTAAGTFAEDTAQPGSFVFDSSRITSPVNTARFRLTADTVVGAFPFAAAQVTPTVYAVRPFVASRALVKTQTALDGVYNRLGIQLTATTAGSSIGQIQIANGGNTLYLCYNVVIYRVDTCTPSTLRTYTVSAGPTADTWYIVNTADPSDNGYFAIARVGDDNVYLSANPGLTAPNVSTFRIGLPDRTFWPASFAARGPSTSGSWGTTSVDAFNYARTQTLPDGTVSTRNAWLGIVSSDSPYGMRMASFNNGEIHFAAQSGKLFAMVGANNATSGGLLEIDLLD